MKMGGGDRGGQGGVEEVSLNTGMRALLEEFQAENRIEILKPELFVKRLKPVVSSSSLERTQVVTDVRTKQCTYSQLALFAHCIPPDLQRGSRWINLRPFSSQIQRATNATSRLPRPRCLHDTTVL